MRHYPSDRAGRVDEWEAIERLKQQTVELSDRQRREREREAKHRYQYFVHGISQAGAGQHRQAQGDAEAAGTDRGAAVGRSQPAGSGGLHFCNSLGVPKGIDGQETGRGGRGVQKKDGRAV